MWRSLTLTRLRFIHAVKVRTAQEGALQRPCQGASVGSGVLFGFVSWGRWSRSLPRHCQSGRILAEGDRVTTAGTSWRLCVLPNQKGILCSPRKPGFYRTPSPQRSPLTTLTKSPVRVRFMLNSQRKPKEVMIPRLGLVNKKEANLQHHNFNSTCFWYFGGKKTFERITF